MGENGGVIVFERRSGFEHARLENEQLRVGFLPELGGRMVEARRLESGSQFLLEPTAHGRSWRRSGQGARFSEHDASGFDECFPTVEATSSTAPGTPPGRKVLEYPDHGELWSRPWTAEPDGDTLVLRICSVGVPYELEKRIRLAENRVEIEYVLRNLGDEPFTYLWIGAPAAARGCAGHLQRGRRRGDAVLEPGNEPVAGSAGTAGHDRVRV